MTRHLINRWTAKCNQPLILVALALTLTQVAHGEVCSDNEITRPAVECLEAKITSLEDKLSRFEMRKGSVIMWSGNIHEIPEGWALCDGKDGRPNLVDRFVIAAGGHYQLDEIGGKSQHNHTSQTVGHTLTQDEIPPHQHKLGEGSADSTTMATGGANQRLAHFLKDQYNAGEEKKTHVDGGKGIPHTHPITDDYHIPPYYALAFIVKL